MSEQEFNNQYDNLSAQITELSHQQDQIDIWNWKATKEIGDRIRELQDKKADLVIAWRKQRDLPV